MADSRQSTRKSRRRKASSESQRMRRRRASWEALGAVASRMSKGLPLSAVLNEAVRDCAKALHADVFAVMILNEEGDELVIETSLGLDSGMLPPIVVVPGEDLVQAARKGLPQWALPDTLRARRNDNPLDCAALIPLEYQNTALGVLLAIPSLDRDTFQPDEIAILTCLANQISTIAFMDGPARVLMATERMERDLHLAHALKGRTLHSRVPRIDNCQISLRYLRCLDLGGDFHDFLPLAGGRHAMVIGESSGRGLEGALNLVQLIPHIRGALAQGLDLSAIVRQLNDEIAQSSHRGQMVSLCLAELDQKEHMLRMVRVGNTSAYLIRKGRIEDLAGNQGRPLGVLLGYEARVVEYFLEEGMSFVMHTDGLKNCYDDEGIPYTSEKLLSLVEPVCLDAKPGAERRSMADVIGDHVMLHNASDLLQDDVTVFSIECTGS